jgi:hypothetical protein
MSCELCPVRAYCYSFLQANRAPHSAWQVNTEIRDLDMDELKGMVARNEQGKRTKQLWNAFEVAAEEHDLDYFKKMLVEHEKRVIMEQQELEEKEAKKEEKEAKKASRKSLPAATEDVEMEDATSDAAPKKKKAPAKRKASALKEGESEGEALKVRTALIISCLAVD